MQAPSRYQLEGKGRFQGIRPIKKWIEALFLLHLVTFTLVATTAAAPDNALVSTVCGYLNTIAASAVVALLSWRSIRCQPLVWRSLGRLTEVQFGAISIDGVGLCGCIRNSCQRQRVSSFCSLLWSLVVCLRNVLRENGRADSSLDPNLDESPPAVTESEHEEVMLLNNKHTAPAPPRSLSIERPTSGRESNGHNTAHEYERDKNC